MALFRLPHLPQDLLPESLGKQPVPIALQVAQEVSPENPADLWNVMDNEIRPAIRLIVTLTIDPYQELITPAIRSRELRFGQATAPAVAQELVVGSEDVFWTIGGSLQSDRPLDGISLVLLERSQEIPIQEEGRFAIGKLRAGNYTLEIRFQDGKPKQHKITVPAPDYVLEV